MHDCENIACHAPGEMREMRRWTCVCFSFLAKSAKTATASPLQIHLALLFSFFQFSRFCFSICVSSLRLCGLLCSSPSPFSAVRPLPLPLSLWFRPFFLMLSEGGGCVCVCVLSRSLSRAPFCSLCVASLHGIRFPLLPNEP